MIFRYTRFLRFTQRSNKRAFSTPSPPSGDPFAVYWSGLAAFAGWSVTLSTFYPHYDNSHLSSSSSSSLQMTQDIALFSSIFALLSWNSAWLFRCHLLNVMTIVGTALHPWPSTTPLLQRYHTTDWQCHEEIIQTKHSSRNILPNKEKMA